MSRRGSDQAGRWPWGMWLALVGVSAGTVGSFAMVGWAFMALTSGPVGTGGEQALNWDADEVVIEADQPLSGSGPGGAGERPSTQERGVPEPESSPVAPQEPAPAPERTAEPAPPQQREPDEAGASPQPPRLVIVDGADDARPPESGPVPESGQDSNKGTDPELVLEQER